LLVGVVGGAALQGNDAPEAGVVDVAEPAADEAPGDAARPATAPDRVADSAGFPSVSQAERDRGQVETAGPVVTVNGRPLGGEEESVDDTQVAAIPAVPETPAAVVPAPIAEPEPVDTQVAVIEPPLPKPRPANLGVQTAPSTGLDYNAIAGAAFGESQDQIIRLPEREGLAPMPGVSEFEARTNYDPNQDELVGVVGPNGEVVWVYEEQVPNINSRVTVQRQQPQQPPLGNPFGFIYE
jgi:hypothetical protein